MSTYEKKFNNYLILSDKVVYKMKSNFDHLQLKITKLEIKSTKSSQSKSYFISSPSR